MGKLLWRRLWCLLHRDRLERELAEEMAAHREMMSADRRPHFGNDTRLREDAREAWSWRWLEEARQDLAYGARVLWRAPGFALGAAAVLALGLGANLAEFEIFNRMVFHRLTFRGVEECLQFTHGGHAGPRLGFPAGVAEVYRARTSTLAWLIAEDATFETTADGDVGRRTTFVSPNYFATLGLAPAWGRLLDAADGAPGAPIAVVFSYEYWQGRWAGDPAVVGRVIRINDKLAQVVGVLPYDFEGLMRRSDLWLPLPVRPAVTGRTVDPAADFTRASVTLYGKPKPGVSRAAVESELTAITQALGRPDSFDPDERVRAAAVQPSAAVLIRRYPALAVFIVIVLLVLLSACANLANMLLARGLTRQREMAIRLSIGASRARVVRQLMTENLLLAGLGALAGLACGRLFARFLLYALGAPPGYRPSVSAPIVAGGFVLAFASAAVFGLPAALRTVRCDPRKFRLRQRLVGVQVAISCLLLISSAVLAHSGIASASLDVTFDYRNMAIVYPQSGARNLAARLAGLPGVLRVTAAVNPPFGERATIESVPGKRLVYRNAVAASYFDAMNAPLLRGRLFSDGEENVVIVSDSAARALWPGADPVGKPLHLANADRTVVGVVKDSGANLLAHPDSVEAYVPLTGAEWDRAPLILRARSDPAAVVRLAMETLKAEHETVPVTLMRTARENALLAMRRMVTLFGSLAALAVGLAAAGMFALIAFAVAQRKRELSIRMAIGAAPRNILGILLGQNAKAMLVGVAAGSVLAAILSRVVRGMIALAGKDTVDTLGFAVGIAAFLIVAALATLTPALRALRIDPAATLREE
jgi:predicted permease